MICFVTSSLTSASWSWEVGIAWLGTSAVLLASSSKIWKEGQVKGKVHWVGVERGNWETDTTWHNWSLALIFWITCL